MSQIEIYPRNSAMGISCGGAVVTNNGPSVIFYGAKQSTTTSVNDGSLAVGSSTTLQGTQYFTTVGRATVNIGAIPVSPSLVNTIVFSQAGNATISTSGPWRVPATTHVAVYVSLACATAPLGSNLVVDFKKNGVTFSTLTIVAGSSAGVANVAGQGFDPGDLLTVATTSVGSGTPATNVVAQVDYS